MTKKNVLILSLIGSIVAFILLFITYHISCRTLFFTGECYWIKIHLLNPITPLLFPIILIFFFSLITYKMREEVFRSWWRFARWFVPVIMVVTFLINSQRQGGGMGIGGAIRSSFNLFIIGIFYAIFIITSAIKIALTYRSKK